MDPDIPPDIQKVFFISESNGNQFRLLLNGFPMEAMGNTIPWVPKAGKYSLALADAEGKILDYIYSEVRGPHDER